ncbi:MAG: hypothetical protein AAF288_05535 [Planctomycetota bacterium]
MNRPKPVQPWELAHNPILRRGLRARLRPKTAIGMGAVVLTVAVFLAAFPILTAQNRIGGTPGQGADLALVLLLGFQGILLLLGGTGAAASGMAKERADNVLDYQRMTPMPTPTKIVGMLYGLPAREYALAALVLPVVLYCAAIANVDPFALLRFYAVMLLSVAAYHMTGMTAGMIAKRPWRANMIAQGMVVLLYLVLPRLSFFQLDAFEYLTLLPAAQEFIASQDIRIDGEGLPPPSDVPLFTAAINPTLFSGVMLGLLLTCLSHVVARRWKDDAANLFGKRFAYLFVAGACTLATGAFWPLVEDPNRFLEERGGMGVEAAAVFMLSLHLCLCLGAGMLAVLAAAPDRFATIRGDRRRLKLDLPSIGWRRDEATAAPLMAWSAVVIAGAFFILFGLLRSRPDALDPTPAWSLALAPAGYAVLALFFLGLGREVAGPRGVLLLLFAAWVVPVLAGILLGGATENEVLAMYVLSLMPVFGVVLEVSTMVDQAMRFDHSLASELGAHRDSVRLFGLVFYGVASAVLGLLWMRRRSRLFQLAKASMEGEPSPLAGLAVTAAGLAQPQDIDQPGNAQGQ